MNKGFTLVELLAVIVLVSIIALITVVSVNSTVSDTKNTLSSTQIKNIERAAESYNIREGIAINDTCVSVTELIEKGYIEANSVQDPKNREEMTGYVKITSASNQYSYKYQEESCKACKLTDSDSDNFADMGEMITCSLTDGTEKFYVVENDGTNIQMLTEYHVDKDNYRQNSSGSYVGFSTTNYWSSTVSQYPAYVYGDYKDEEGVQQNLAFTIVEEYVSYLKSNGISEATGKLMQYEQAALLGCDIEIGDCSSAPIWVSVPKYWFGAAYDDQKVYYLERYTINGDDQLHVAFRASFYDFHDYDRGVRPVITISKNEID